MKRRTVLAGLGGALGWPLAVRAQPAGRVFKVGLVFTTSPVSEMIGPEPISPVVRAFMQGMRDLGYAEGRNLILVCRSAEGRLERLLAIVAELVDRRVDVIVTTGDKAAQDAKRVTTVVPIVMMVSYDPVGAGVITSLARPGGNITGLTNNPGPDVESKMLQLLKEVVPAATRIAFLGMAADWNGPQGAIARATAPKLGVSLVFAEVTPTNYADAFALMTRDRPDAFYLAANPAHWANRQIIAEFVVKQRLPSIYPYRDIVDAGGLISYGSNPMYLFHRAASFVDKILQGAKPADLPVEQPTKIEFIINLKTAAAFGLTIPATLLANADELIE